MLKKIYFTPGPAELFYTFNDHLKKALLDNIPSISHRSSQFIKIVKHTTETLKELLGLPDGYDVFFIHSANEAWDRIIQNLVANHSHHFINGAFSKKFYDFALLHQKKSTCAHVNDGHTFDGLSVPDNAELIGVTKNETSVGYSFTEEEIAQIRKANPDKLLALDIVSASPSLKVDFSQIDTAYFSVQKGFGLPPGLGVWIANHRCQEKASQLQKDRSIGSYRSLPNLKKFADKSQTPETPNTLFVYLLGKVAEDMLKAGRQRIQNDTIYKSAILYRAIEDHPGLTPFVRSYEHRSKSTIVFESNDPSRFINYFSKTGFIMGTGYGPHKGHHIRIANFPAHSKELMELVCDKIGEIV